MIKKVIFLDQSEMPTKFYNIQHDLPKPLEPFLDPVTGKPVNPEMLMKLFPKKCVEQEMSKEEFIDIPKPILDLYKVYRPSPLVRAERLEKFLGTPAHIYFKNEGVSPTGAHKVNTALVQAYYAKEEGVKRLTCETGAGQYGSAISYANSMFGLETTIYMVKVSFDQKPYRKIMMQIYGADVVASPSVKTKYGRMILAKDPDCKGSLGIAISEAMEDAMTSKDTKYALGSFLNCVCMHQTIIGLEAKKQMEKAGEYPDVVIACVGGGSNFSGISFPFLQDKLKGDKPNLRVVAVEPTSCASLTKGEYKYDFGDSAGTTPLAKMYTLGKDFMPDPLHAGGLRYHGMAPVVSALYNQKLIEAVAYPQTETFAAALTFARTEGLIVAPESAHAIKAAIDEAIKAKKQGKEKVILFNLSGNGYLDLQGYDDYLKGKFN
jgi:tryptophan synthase beta chain